MLSTDSLNNPGCSSCTNSNLHGFARSKVRSADYRNDSSAPPSVSSSVSSRGGDSDSGGGGGGGGSEGGDDVDSVNAESAAAAEASDELILRRRRLESDAHYEYPSRSSSARTSSALDFQQET